ncbi:FKBP-type peptidyl-prolyl cis-trans isomerase [Marinilabiliaceae bacterium D04]|uniref:Peptidyl-prolyl cis-trans isomerase n=2 Tax=Plebeiibacterium marinum TaxID=2992111 RepID=A0AAE3MF36_9BACT|nr:FKBP-type peptidyl-prolyl cis-trans isomerase [Plebeiobacterium marinum]
MKNETDSVSYALGYVIASQMKQQLSQQFDTLYGKDVAMALAKSQFSEASKQNFERSFDSINYDIMKSAFLNEVGYAKSYFNETTGNAYLQAAYKRAQDRKALQPGKPAFENKKKGDEFLAENAKKEGVITTESGLQYEILKQGKGDKPVPGDKVEVHYHGTLIDGTVFDSSVDRGETTTFGVTQVIKGWVEGLQLMNVGSKFKFYIPAELAYGMRGSGGKIGPMETLVFEVELFNIIKKEEK